ncbi:MAG: DUF192 domain-containing protein [Acidobacteriota bacterium]|nr:DUF192 domain-containing protein [Acidobacteriota bacterium]
MSFVSVRNEDREQDLGDRVRVADRWWPRLRGMIGYPEPSDGEGLLIRPCQGVHMHWMTYPLDIVFLDDAGRVVALYHGLKPWRFSKTHKEASCAIELPAGTLEHTGTRVGDRLTWSDTRREAA